jgi:hypothetical protein
MKTKITLAILALTVVVVLSPTAEAQRAGFVVGLGPGAVHQSISPHLVGPVVQPFVSAPPFGGVIPPRHHVPRGQVFHQGQVIFIGPPTVKYGPGFDRSVGPIVAPYVSVVTPRGSGVFPRGAGVFPRRRRGRFGGTRIVQPGVPSVVVNRPGRGIRNAGTVTGLPRADVLRRFGRPNVTVYNAQGETLIFGHTTIIIQNGVVAFVQ